MTKSNIRGGKHHKKGKKRRDGPTQQNNSMVAYAANNQIYASVLKRLGGSRLSVECSDGKNRSAIIPGKFFKRVWINEGDVLLCEFTIGNQDEDCYILLKYSTKDANVLKSQGKINFDISEETEDSGYKFTDENIVPQQRFIPDINSLGVDENKLGDLDKDNTIENDDDDNESIPDLDEL